MAVTCTGHRVTRWLVRVWSTSVRLPLTLKVRRKSVWLLNLVLHCSRCFRTVDRFAVGTISQGPWR